MASTAVQILSVLVLVVAVAAQRPTPGAAPAAPVAVPAAPAPVPAGPVAAPAPVGGALNLPGAAAGAPAAPIGRPNPKPTAPTPIYAPESSINFNWGYLTVRAGCCLRALMSPADKGCKNADACNDAPDQGTWQVALDTWSTAGQTWVQTCTKKGTVKMGVGCPPDIKPFVSMGARYTPKPNTWVQYWLKKREDYVSVNALFQNSLLDLRQNTMWLHQSVFQFVDGFLYVAANGALGLNETNIYMEDSNQGELSAMGAAMIGNRAKIGCIKSGIVMNNSIFGWDAGKIWLIESSYKQYGGAFVVENTSFWFERSQMSFWDMQQGHVARTTWNLTNSQLNLVKSTIRVWDSTIILSGSHINLNESRLLLSNTIVLGDNFAFSTVNVSENFGVTLGQRLDALSVDFKVEAEDGKVVLKAKKDPPVANTGR